jgi:hypothetical protein
MKSAYELAMERLQVTDPEAATPLTGEQKEALAEIDRTMSAKVAEREIFLQKQLADALNKGEFEEAEKIKKQLINEKARLEEEREERKEKVRKG